MQIVISLLSGFFIVQMTFGLFFAQLGLDEGAFRVFFDEAGTVPLILLSFGQWIHIAALALVVAFLENIPPSQILFPRFAGSGIDSGGMEAPRLDLIWEWISVALVLILPMIGILYWWLEFLNLSRGAWIKSSNQVVGIFERVPGCHFIDNWDVCRYGTLPPRTGTGDSFVPFWQPVIIMGGGSLVIILITIFLLLKVWKRAPVRRLEVLTAPN